MISARLLSESCRGNTRTMQRSASSGRAAFAVNSGHIRPGKLQGSRGHRAELRPGRLAGHRSGGGGVVRRCAQSASDVSRCPDMGYRHSFHRFISFHGVGMALQGKSSLPPNCLADHRISLHLSTGPVLVPGWGGHPKIRVRCRARCGTGGPRRCCGIGTCTGPRSSLPRQSGCERYHGTWL